MTTVVLSPMREQCRGLQQNAGVGRMGRAGKHEDE